MLDNLLFALNAVLPIILLVLVGFVLKKIHFFSDEFIKGANKFVFYLALPILLFKNLYDSLIDEMPWKLIIFSAIAIVFAFVVALVYSIVFVKDRYKRGAVGQGIIRTNFAFIGIPLATSLFSDSTLIAKTTLTVSLLSIFAIPMFNMLGVVLLSLSSEKGTSKVDTIKKTLLGILKNPLIHGILLGLLVLIFRLLVPSSAFIIRDKVPFIYKTISNLASVSTPLALVVVGAQFDIKLEGNDIKNQFVPLLLKMVIIPFVVLFVSTLFKFNNYEYACLISLFSSPIAVASAIMAREMGSDYKLASNLVVYSTIISSITIFLTIFIFRSLGFL